MTYKTKVGIAIGIGFGFIIVMAIVMMVFVSNNSDNKTIISNQTGNSTNSSADDNTNNIEDEVLSLSPVTEIEMDLENVYSLAIQNKTDGEYLVKISNDLESESVVNLNNIDGFIGYDYFEKKVFLAFNQTEGLLIYSIDLNTNEDALICELEYNLLNSFYIYDGNIYYVTVNNSIYEYNIEEDLGEEIIIPEDNETIVNLQVDKDNNCFYYMKNAISNDENSTFIYKVNLDDISEESIISSESKGQEIVLYKNYLVCNLLGEYYSTTYIYNIDNKSFWKIGDFVGEKVSGNIDFSEDYIVFSDFLNISIFDYDGNIINESLYSIESEEEIVDASTIYYIMFITENKLQIRGIKNDSTFTKIIDFESSTIEDASNYYDNVLRIK